MAEDKEQAKPQVETVSLDSGDLERIVKDYNLDHYSDADKKKIAEAILGSERNADRQAAIVKSTGEQRTMKTVIAYSNKNADELVAAIKGESVSETQAGAPTQQPAPPQAPAATPQTPATRQPQENAPAAPAAAQPEVTPQKKEELDPMLLLKNPKEFFVQLTKKHPIFMGILTMFLGEKGMKTLLSTIEKFSPHYKSAEKKLKKENFNFSDKEKEIILPVTVADMLKNENAPKGVTQEDYARLRSLVEANAPTDADKKKSVAEMLAKKDFKWEFEEEETEEPTS